MVYDPVRGCVRELLLRSVEDGPSPSRDEPAATAGDSTGSSAASGPSKWELAFWELRQQNVIRCATAFHALDDWSPLEWAGAMAGEAGEACNAVKKLKRFDDENMIGGDRKELRARLVRAIADELADTVIYLDLLAARLDIDLGEAVAQKFNEVSERVGCEVRLGRAVQPGKDAAPGPGDRSENWHADPVTALNRVEHFDEFTAGMLESIERAGSQNQDVVRKLARFARSLRQTEDAA